MITVFGTLLAGAIAVPLSIKLLPEEIAFRLNHSGAKFIAVSHLTLEKFLDALPEVKHLFQILYLDESGEEFFKQLDQRGIDRKRGNLFFSSVKDGMSEFPPGTPFEEDGFLVVVGREKALLISFDGEKYSPEEIEEAIQTLSPFVFQIMLYNDHRKYTSALVVLDEGSVRIFLAQEKVLSEIFLLDRITDSILSSKRDPYYGNRVPSYWLPVTLAILPELFTEQNRMINSTLKIVRYRIVEVYRNTIEYLYIEEKPCLKNPRNLEVLKRYF